MLSSCKFWCGFTFRQGPCYFAQSRSVLNRLLHLFAFLWNHSFVESCSPTSISLLTFVNTVSTQPIRTESKIENLKGLGLLLMKEVQSVFHINYCLFQLTLILFRQYFCQMVEYFKKPGQSSPKTGTINMLLINHISANFVKLPFTVWCYGKTSNFRVNTKE